MIVLEGVSFSNLLHQMAPGTHRRFNVEGHRVYVRCSSTGERYVLIDGTKKFNVTAPDFVAKVTEALTAVS